MSLSAKEATPYKPGAGNKSNKVSSSASKASSADRSTGSSTSRKLSLAQQIAGLVNPTPADFDPEDADNGGYTGIGSSKYDDEDDDMAGGAPKLMAERSQIRKNFDVEDVSEEYKGKVVSRKNLSAFSDDEEEEADEDEEEDEDEAGEDDEEMDEEMEDEEEDDEDGEDEDDDEDGEDDEDEDDEDGTGVRGMLSDGLDDQQRKVQAQLAALEEEDEEEANASSLFKPRGDAAASMSVTSSSAASQYTKSVQMKNQLTWYTQLLNVRIRLQGVLNNANRLPAPATINKSSSTSTNARAQFEENSEEVKPAFNKAAKEAGKLLEDLLNLQSDLMQQNTIFTQSRKNADDDNDDDEDTDMEETSVPRFAGSKRKRNDEENDDDADTAAESVTSGEEALDSYWSYMRSQMDPFFRPIQDALIEKWNQKTQLSAGQLTSLSGSSGQGREARNAAGGLQGLKVINQSILAQIDSVLLDENRLVKRSQLFRNHAADANLLGRVDRERERASKRLKKSKAPANEIDQLLDSEKNEVEEEYDEFIYDDNDYYQQVLSEIISAAGSADATTGTGADSELVSSANAARKKTRKSGAMVDRRASKGRKIRYAVHAKLANFMAPKAAPISTEYVPSAASNSSIGNLGSGFAMDELFLNLFGGQAKE